MNSIAFIDCYGDLAERFTPEMQKFLPELKVIYGKTLNEKDIIKRIGNHTNILVYMAFISKEVLNSCKNLKSIAYLSTGLKTHGDLETAKLLGVSPITVDRLAKRDLLRPSRATRRPLYSKAEIQRFLEDTSCKID